MQMFKNAFVANRFHIHSSAILSPQRHRTSHKFILSSPLTLIVSATTTGRLPFKGTINSRILAIRERFLRFIMRIIYHLFSQPWRWLAVCRQNSSISFRSHASSSPSWWNRLADLCRCTVKWHPTPLSNAASSDLLPPYLGLLLSLPAYSDHHARNGHCSRLSQRWTHHPRYSRDTCQN